MTAKRAPKHPPVSDKEVRDLLRRYRCPVPFHEVRTRFLGSIVTPASSVSPIKVVQSLWGGELPVFDSLDEANELLGLVMGLWNRLTAHQERRSPFRLTRIDTGPSPESISALALMRREEIGGFVMGLFGEEDALDLPERARKGLNLLGKIHGAFVEVLDLASNPSVFGTDKELQTSLIRLQMLTRDAEREIHAIAVACTLARRRSIRDGKQTAH